MPEAKRIHKEKELLELKYNDAPGSFFEGQKQLLEFERRKKLEQAKQVYVQNQRLFATEQLGILELNKAKIAWLQDQFERDQIDIRIKNTLMNLQKLNGGNWFSDLTKDSEDSFVKHILNVGVYPIIRISWYFIMFSMLPVLLLFVLQSGLL